MQDVAEHVAGAHALLEQVRHRGHTGKVLLQLIDNKVQVARHDLHDEAARLADAGIGVHQHAHTHRGGNLVADREVVGEVLANLARGQLYLA